MADSDFVEPGFVGMTEGGAPVAAADVQQPAPATSQVIHNIAYPLLWFTSNTPIETGQRTCSMRRYLQTHAGRHGTGYNRIATAVPLATGSGVHKGMQLVGEWILDWQTAHPGQRLTDVPAEVIAWAAGEAAARYEQKARNKGLELTKGDIDALAANEQLIFEQRTLVEGLTWVYCMARLPVMLASHRLIAVELEQGPVLDCTCGLGDWVGDYTHHGPRGCAGIVAQGRCDYLWERIEDSEIVYEEFKTKAQEKKSWEDAWEHNGQLWLNMEGASRRLGKEVNTAYVPILFKGWRGRDRGRPPTDPKTQHSPLCYGYFDPGNPPLRDPEWSPRYRWTDDYGKTKQVAGTFNKVPIWDEQYPLMMQGMRPDASRVEVWVRQHLAESQWPDLMKVLGPFPRPRQRLSDAENALKAEERLWRERVQVLREEQAYEASHPLVTELIPRSWNCTQYDGTPCPMKRVCDKEPGWDTMDAMGLYEHRAPHHVPEREAFEALGRVFATDEMDEDGEDE